MKKIKVIYLCLCLVLIYSACSCGARKVLKQETKEEVHIESTDNSIITSNIDTFTKFNVINKDESVTTENVFEPIDNTKEASIIDSNGKKTVLNNARKVIRNTVAKNEQSGNSEQLKKEAVHEQKAKKDVVGFNKESKAKDIDKKQFNPLSLIWIIGLIVFFGITIYRIYKKLPLVPKF